MTRKQKRDASRAKRRAVVSKLKTDSLTGGDWSIICASLIHERDEQLGEAEDYTFLSSSMKDALRSRSLRAKSKRTNAVLVKIGHPAAFSDEEMEK